MTRSLALSLTMLALGGVTLSACANDVNLGRGQDAGRDGGTFRPRTDECGNGIDDDRNGRIDDGCVCGTGDVQSCFSGDYPSHGVGACRDGSQTCAVQEFGDWGMFDCVGETLPAPEICDDIDNDCDGVTDEGCPCAVGATRACSDEFAVAPCMPGTQTCRGGTWSLCEGAVGPSADICEDAIDNDCDGNTNEGCDCVSSPEQCANRIDDDCDGEVDEVTCAPFPDAGMSTPDAGVDGGFIAPTCTPTLTRIASLPGQWLNWMAFSGPTLYASVVRTGGGGAGDIVRVALPSGATTSLVSSPFIASFALADGVLCFSSTDGVHCGPPDGPHTVLALPSGATALPSAVAVSGSDVYWFATFGTRIALLRTTSGTTTELWRETDTERVFAMRQIVADATGVNVVLSDVNFVGYTNSLGGENGSTGAFSVDGTHEHITHIDRSGTRTRLWTTGTLPVPARAPTDPNPYWQHVASTMGASLHRGALVWTEGVESWGIASELGAPVPNGYNPYHVRMRPLDGSMPMQTLVDDMSVPRRTTWWAHQTDAYVYTMSQTRVPDGATSQLERVRRTGGPSELVQYVRVGDDNRIPLNGVAQLGDCLYVAIRLGNTDSEIHTIRVE